MRKYNRGFFVTGILAIIILAVHPLAGLTFGDTSATEPAPYSFISVDIPNSSGELVSRFWQILTIKETSWHDSPWGNEGSCSIDISGP